MIQKTIKYLILPLLISLVFSCSSDDDDNPAPTVMMDECDGTNVSYKDDIVPIVNATCAIAGCHIAGFGSGDFTDFDGLKDKASSLKSRVVDDKNMPPSNTLGPKSLTPSEIKKFMCWIDAGAPNN